MPVSGLPQFFARLVFTMNGNQIHQFSIGGANMTGLPQSKMVGQSRSSKRSMGGGSFCSMWTGCALTPGASAAAIMPAVKTDRRIARR
jgi:hypothetical protein